MNESYSFYTNKLSGEYHETFSKIELYVVTKYIDDATKEEYLSELLDIFLIAQSKGKPVQKITGNNLEHFCRTFCSGYGIKNRVLDFLDFIKSIIWVIFVFTIIDMLFLFWDYADGIQIDFWHSNSSVNIPVYLIGILIAILIGYVSNLIVRNIMFQTKHISMKILQSIYLLVIIAVMILTCIIMTINDNLWNIPIWVVMLMSVMYLVPYYLLNYKRLAEKKRNKVRFKEMVSITSENDFSKAMEKRFQTASKKNIKKGKGELTIEDFLKNEEKDCKKTENSKWFYLLIPVPITALAFVGTCFFGGFETVADVLIFPILIMIIQYAIMIGLWKITKNGVAQRKLWIDEKRKELNCKTDKLDYISEEITE